MATLGQAPGPKIRILEPDRERPPPGTGRTLAGVPLSLVFASSLLSAVHGEMFTAGVQQQLPELEQVRVRVRHRRELPVG